MDVSVIIVNYNTKQLTFNCIQSIVDKTSGIEYEIILVDNASTDGSKDLFLEDSRIKYIYSERNGGFGYGNNLGIQIARGKYLFLLNSDTILLNNAIKEFYDYAESHNNKTIYGCYLKGVDDTYRNSFFYFPAFTIKQFLSRIINKPNYEPDYTDKEVECISGADMFFTRDAIEQCGGFDENIFLYGEEGELQYRFKNHGYLCMIINSPQIIHLEGASMKMSLGKLTIKFSSHFYILKKHMNPFTYNIARIYYALNLGIRNMDKFFSKEGRLFLSILIKPMKKNLPAN